MNMKLVHRNQWGALRVIKSEIESPLLTIHIVSHVFGSIHFIKPVCYRSALNPLALYLTKA